MLKENSVFCMMDYFNNIGDLGKSKNLLEIDFIKKEMIKIKLFDGLFRSSDNILKIYWLDFVKIK